MKAVAVAPILLPLGGAALSLALHRRVALQRAISLLCTSGTLVASVVILCKVGSSGPVVVNVGGWPAPVGITLVADLTSSLILAVSAATTLAVLVFAIGQLTMLMEARYFHPLYLVLTGGVGAALLTGDLFNLFVAFEVMLIASYALLTLGGGGLQIRPALTYVVVNLFASSLFLTGVGLVYASVGTVNMADLSLKIPTLDPGLQSALAVLFFMIFGIKAAIFPLFFWLPDSYPTAPTPITAVFAGLLTKIGVYSIIRIQSVVFGGGGVPKVLVLSIAAATMVVGVLGAIAQDDMKRILSFHIVSQIGYMIFGFGLSTAAGLAATILFVVHQIPVKASLFLVSGLIEKTTGTGALHRLGGMARRMPVAGALFMAAALSLAGLPPLSGFFGKLALVQAGIASGDFVLVAVSLVVSLLTLFSMLKIWAGVFWGEPDEPPPEVSARGTSRLRAPALMTAATAGLVALTLGIALWVEPIYGLCARAAQELGDTSRYVSTVMGR